MDNLALVKVLETGEDLPHELADESLFERAVVREQRGDRSSRDVLEENVEVSGVGGGVEVLDDVCLLSSAKRAAGLRERAHSHAEEP